MTTIIYVLSAVFGVLLSALGCAVPAAICALVCLGVFVTPEAKHLAVSALRPLVTATPRARVD